MKSRWGGGKGIWAPRGIFFKWVMNKGGVANMNAEGRGHKSVYYASPQSLKITFSYSLSQQHWEILLNVD